MKPEVVEMHLIEKLCLAVIAAFIFWMAGFIGYYK